MKFSAIFVVCLVFSVTYESNAAVSCGVVDMSAAPCVTFAQGKAPTPLPACCNGLQKLVSTVKSLDDKKAICRCLEAGVKNFAGVQDKFLSNLPAACKINVGFPVSMNTNCKAIH